MSSKAYKLSPLQKMALFWAGGLFLAWERAFILAPLLLTLLLISRLNCSKFWPFCLAGLLAFFLGLKIFPPPQEINLKKSKGEFIFLLESPLIPGEWAQRAEAKLIPSKEKAILYFPTYIHLNPGEKFKAYTTLRPPRGHLNPFSGSLARQKLAQGFKFTGYVRKVEKLEQVEKKPIALLRAKLFTFAENLSPQARGLFECLILGEKRNIPLSLREKFEKTGLFHLLAVSGLHIAILFGLIVFVFRKILLVLPTNIITRLLNKFTAKQWCYLLAFPLVLAYVLVSGPSPSALRAFVMFTLYGLALWCWREIRGFDLLALAVILILLFQPEAVGSLSFRLSVSAVIGLLLAHRLLKRLPENLNPVVNYLVNGLGYSLAASLFTAPFIFWLKGSISPWAPLTNLIAIPLWGFLVLPLEFLATGTALLGLSWAKVPAELAAKVISWPILPLPQITAPYPIGAFLLTFLLLAIALAMVKINRRFALGIGLFTLALGLWFYRANQELSYVMILDIGQGSCAVAKNTEKGVILFDTGPARGPYDSAIFVTLPLLHKMGILQVQTIVISHFQADHAGGLKSILKEYPQAQVFSPEKIPGQLSQLHFYPANSFFKGNDSSLVSRLNLKGFTFLFPGDITRGRELTLIKENIKADVLILPHHGSNTSSSYPFLKKVEPILAISSSRWQKHPSKKILKRLADLNIPHYGTKTSGALTVFVENGRIFLCEEVKRRKAPLLMRALWPYLRTGCTEVKI